MSKYAKLNRHPRMDPDVWAAYEEVWKEWTDLEYSKRSNPNYFRIYQVEGKIDVLEKLLNSYIERQYLRAGEPIRTGIRDIIEYHNKLDRQFGIKIAERQEQ